MKVSAQITNRVTGHIRVCVGGVLCRDEILLRLQFEQQFFILVEYDGKPGIGTTTLPHPTEIDKRQTSMAGR